MKNHFYLLLLFMATHIQAQMKTVSADVDWQLQHVTLKNTSEAEYIIRVGDVDNLNFGWPDSFDPFCGRMTQAHYFPWEPNSDDLPGFDRILQSQYYISGKGIKCGADGYSESFLTSKNIPGPIEIAIDVLKGITIENAYIQIFLDDFQAPTFCSHYTITINNKRFIEGEKLLNLIDQTGPIGKLVSIPLPEEFYPMLVTGDKITVKIDENTGAADGFALDFVRLLVNRKRENSCKGTIRGIVLEKTTEKAISKAKVYTAENLVVETNDKGEFEMKNIPTGYEVILASAIGYVDGASTADVGEGNENPGVIIYLTKGKTAKFDNKQVMTGESVTLNNILFNQGNAEIKNESKPDLEKVVLFMKSNPSAEIELSGHTSSEGERSFNRSLSYKRVKACKEYIVLKGIAEYRIITIGFGPDRPISSNTTEEGRKQNRRVEMRISSL